MTPLAWNTLQEAADYLTARTGTGWTQRRVLDASLKAVRQRPNGEYLPSAIKAAPPRATRFILCHLDLDFDAKPGLLAPKDIGANTYPFVPQHNMPWQTVPLYPVHLGELLCCGQTLASIAQRPEDARGQAGVYVLVEPPLTVNFEMLGMTGKSLLWLASTLAPAPATEAAPDTDRQAGTTTKGKGGRPREIDSKAVLIRDLVESMHAGKELDPTALPGSAADLLDACKRIEKAKTDRNREFGTTEDTFKKWLKAAGYGFKTGRTPDAQAKYWTTIAVQTMGKISRDIFP